MKTLFIIALALLPLALFVWLATDSERALEICLLRHSIEVCNHELNGGN